MPSMNGSVWRNCRTCNRRYDNVDPRTGLCPPCHNAVIDARKTAAGRPAPRPPWCGLCSDERTRQVEVPRDPAQVANGYSDTVIDRCPRCHPLAANRLRRVS